MHSMRAGVPGGARARGRAGCPSRDFLPTPPAPNAHNAHPHTQAFLAVRALAVAVPEPYLERCLKGMYRTFLANSKFVSAASAPHIAVRSFFFF